MSALYPQMLKVFSQDDEFDRVVIEEHRVSVLYLEEDREHFWEDTYPITDAARVVSYCRWHRIAYCVTGADQ